MRLKKLYVSVTVYNKEDKAMNKLVNKAKVFIICVCYGAMVSFPVVADDIEIYTNSGTTTPGLQANVLFLLDTSLSMGAVVTILAPYDQTIDYKALPANAGNPCFDADLLYRMDNNGIVNKAEQFCNGNASGDIDPNTNGNGSGRVGGTVKISRFYCKAASMISGGVEVATSSGFYLGRVRQYRDNGGTSNVTWRNVGRLDPNDVVECGADQGVHGETVAGPVYSTKLNNQTSAWTSTSTDAKDWSNFGAQTLYSGNYLNYLQTSPSTDEYRIELIRDVMRDFVASTSGINLGFMPFSQRKLANPSGSLGGMVEVAIDDIANTRADIDARLVYYGERIDFTDNSLSSGHDRLVLGTPLSQQYFEAMRYFQGGQVNFGLNALPAPSISDSLASGSASVPLPGGTLYESPISNECQKNYIVVLTDGQPYRDPMTSSQLSSMGVTPAGIAECADECVNGSCGQSNCLDHLAFAAGSIDQSSAFTGDQTISTFTIAFGSNIGILNDTTAASRATTGEGASFVATNAQELAGQLRQVVASVLDAENTFSSPAISVNAFNRAVHLDDLYFTLFKPGSGPHWAGNLKKYKLKTKADTQDFDNDGDLYELVPFIEDARPDEAIDAATGFFDGNALSYWSDPTDPDGNDGKDVTRGGAVGEFTNSRKVYTYTGSYNTSDGIMTPVDTDINRSENELNKANKSDVTAVLLGIDPTDTASDANGNTVLLHDLLLDWSAGLDVLDADLDSDVGEARQQMGDPLHSQPAIVQYGGTVANPELIAYVATNDGYLHAIDTDDGSTLWSFVPQELLPDLVTLMENIAGGDKNYGLDGNVMSWIDDQNGDGIINGADKVHLYISMRRGGDKIYALDVTDENDPQLLWIIDGGIPGTAYEELGDTWSTVNVVKIKNGATSRPVLIFGGGYDEGQDAQIGSAIERHTDSVGRTVFIADALTGARLWSAGQGGVATTEMNYSIPARVKPLDLSGDGNIDRLYVADMGGQIFRFDIDETRATFSSASVSGGRIAKFAEDNSVENARRFYYPPDVAIVAERGKAAYLGIAISSGYRAHPLETRIHDRIYLFKDRDIFDKPASYVTLTDSDLYDATQNLASTPANANAATIAASDQAITDLDAADGWFIDLDNEASPALFLGEKGLAEPLIVEGNIIITTFVPETGVSINSCTPSEGKGKVFFIDIIDATASYPSDADSRSERHIPLASAGIPPSPNVIITSDGVPTTCIGTECRSLGNVGLRKTFWYEVEK